FVVPASFVIPAQAGIWSPLARRSVRRGSRFRGNDEDGCKEDGVRISAWNVAAAISPLPERRHTKSPLASAGVTPGGRSADGRGRREGTWASQGCLARALLANGGEGCDENSLLGPAVRGGWRSGLAACRLTGSGSGVEVHRA